MPKLKSYKILAPEQDFLAIPDHYVAITGKIAFAELAKLKTTNKASVYGDKEVVARGTVVHIDAEGKVTQPTTTDGTAGEEGGATLGNGILFNTIEIGDYSSDTDDYVNATILVHGFVRTDRLLGADEHKKKVFNEMIYQFKN